MEQQVKDLVEASPFDVIECYPVKVQQETGDLDEHGNPIKESHFVGFRAVMGCGISIFLSPASPLRRSVEVDGKVVKKIVWENGKVVMRKRDSYSVSQIPEVPCEDTGNLHNVKTGNLNIRVGDLVQRTDHPFLRPLLVKSISNGFAWFALDKTSKPMSERQFRDKFNSEIVNSALEAFEDAERAREEEFRI